MKNILDTLTKGGLGGLGDLANSFGSNFGGLGEKLTGALGGQNSQNTQAGQANAKAPTGSSAQNNSGFGLGGLLGAGALGGLLGTLMSGKTAKKVASGVLIAGGTAAVGAVAWNFYQKWSQNQQAAKTGEGAGGNFQATTTQLPSQVDGHTFGSAPSIATPTPPALDMGKTDATAMLLLEAMVYAAKADGHMDEAERNNIQGALSAMFPDRNLIQLIDGLINKPIDPQSLAQRVQNQDEAFDLYRLSCMIVDVDHFMERSYLDALAAALQISIDQKNSLEAEVATAKASQQ